MRAAAHPAAGERQTGLNISVLLNILRGGLDGLLEYPILTTPGLVIDEKLVCLGRVPTKAEVTTYITTALTRRHSAPQVSLRPRTGRWTTRTEDL